MDTENLTSVGQVVETIILGIANKTFEVGKRIPSQRQLSTLFGVSRTVIREAIKTLEGKDILVSVEGSGTYVKQDIHRADRSTEGHLEKFALKDIMQFSKMIWNASFPLIVQNASDEELATFAKRTKDFADNYASATIQEKFIYESSFGMTLCKLTYNELIYQLMTTFLKVTSDIDYRLIASNDNYCNILDIDKKIVSSLVNRNARRAQLWSEERDLEIDRRINAIDGIESELMNTEYTISIMIRNTNGISSVNNGI